MNKSMSWHSEERGCSAGLPASYFLGSPTNYLVLLCTTSLTVLLHRDPCPQSSPAYVPLPRCQALLPLSLLSPGYLFHL